jgi:hypothetical protein
MRDLPFPDAACDTIVSLSTLEHVGMDNSRFGPTLRRRHPTRAPPSVPPSQS